MHIYSHLYVHCVFMYVCVLMFEKLVVVYVAKSRSWILCSQMRLSGSHTTLLISWLGSVGEGGNTHGNKMMPSQRALSKGISDNLVSFPKIPSGRSPASYGRFLYTAKSHYNGFQGNCQTSLLYPKFAISRIKYESAAGTCRPGPLLRRHRYKRDIII